jgi:uncharacterized membrane protein YgcG
VKRSTIALAAWALCLAGCEAAAPPAEAPPAADENEAAATNAAEPAANAAAAASEFPALTGRVVDGAELLSPEEEARLTSRLAQLEARTSDQVVLVTVETLGGRAIEDYGLALGRHWQIGQGGNDNGVLLIVAPNERRTRIEVGFGLQRILTNARARAIVDEDLLPHFREARWSAGITAGTEAISDLLIEHEREPRRGRR